MSELTGENQRKVVSVVVLLALLVVGIVVSITRDSSPSLYFDDSEKYFDDSEKYEWISVCIGIQGSELNVNCPDLATNLMGFFDSRYATVVYWDEEFENKKVKEEIWECIKKDSLTYVQYLDFILEENRDYSRFNIGSHSFWLTQIPEFYPENVRTFYQYSLGLRPFGDFSRICRDFYYEILRSTES